MKYCKYLRLTQLLCQGQYTTQCRFFNLENCFKSRAFLLLVTNLAYSTIQWKKKWIQNFFKNTHHHHHHVVPPAWVSLTLSRHFSLSFISSGRSSGLHPVSSQSCCMYVRAGRPAFARPYVGVHRSTSLMSSSLLLQQCSPRLVRLTCIVFVMGARWPYSWCFVRCCLQNLFNIDRSILV